MRALLLPLAGNYKDLKADLSNKSWRQAQYDHVQEILSFASIKHADKVILQGLPQSGLQGCDGGVAT